MRIEFHSVAFRNRGLHACLIWPEEYLINPVNLGAFYAKRFANGGLSYLDGGKMSRDTIFLQGLYKELKSDSSERRFGSRMLQVEGV